MKIVVTALAAVLVAGALFLAGCAAKKASFGEKIAPGAAVAKVEEILARPTDFADQTVIVEGKITSECPAGGWFYLQGESGQIHVDLHPNNFAIPQSVGKRARALGTVLIEDGRPSIVGSGVELK